MFVRERMTKHPITIDPDDTLATASANMKTGNFRRLPVVRAGELVGILSEYDLQAHRHALGSVLVKSAMTHEPITIAPGATLEHALSLLSRHRIGALPIVEHGKLIGIVTAKDLWVAEPQPLPERDPHGNKP